MEVVGAVMMIMMVKMIGVCSSSVSACRCNIVVGGNISGGGNVGHSDSFGGVVASGGGENSVELWLLLMVAMVILVGWLLWW